MKNEALKKLIKEEIKEILKENTPVNANPTDTPVTTGFALAKDIRNTGNTLMKNPSGIMPKEAEGLKLLLNRLISIAKNGTLNDSILNRINSILAPLDK